MNFQEEFLKLMFKHPKWFNIQYCNELFNYTEFLGLLFFWYDGLRHGHSVKYVMEQSKKHYQFKEEIKKQNLINDENQNSEETMKMLKEEITNNISVKQKYRNAETLEMLRKVLSFESFKELEALEHTFSYFPLRHLDSTLYEDAKKCFKSTGMLMPEMMEKFIALRTEKKEKFNELKEIFHFIRSFIRSNTEQVFPNLSEDIPAICTIKNFIKFEIQFENKELEELKKIMIMKDNYDEMIEFLKKINIENVLNDHDDDFVDFLPYFLYDEWEE